jgi:hypothetical protein
MTLNAPRLRLGGPRPRTRPTAPRRPWMLPATTACAAALGALLEYLLHPGGGRRRRHTARDRAVSRLRQAEADDEMRKRRCVAGSNDALASEGDCASGPYLVRWYAT